MFRSLPALRQALSQMESIEPMGSAAAAFELVGLVPVYYVPERERTEEEARALAAAVATLADRMIRLEEAYQHWQPFEPGPYFDLRSLHAALMCQVEEGHELVHVCLYADLLAPSFRELERFCVERFLPVVRAGRSGTLSQRKAWVEELRHCVWPALQARLAQAEQVIEQATLFLLEAGHVNFLATWGALEEQQRAAVPEGLSIPTLTLDFTFPRSLCRHPHRQQILRRRLQRCRSAGYPLLRRSGFDRARRTQRDDDGEEDVCVTT
jgi:hypothetical protein